MAIPLSQLSTQSFLSNQTHQIILDIDLDFFHQNIAENMMENLNGIKI